MIATSRLLFLAAATCLLPMCTSYNRATPPEGPDEGAVQTTPALRSGSSPDGGPGSAGIPPEPPRR